MTVLDIADGALSARISTAGGIVLGLWWLNGGERVPLLRPAPSNSADALAAGCFPLVPFCNRVKDNRFTFGGREFVLAANTSWDPHYLHGEGWQAAWSITRRTDAEVEMTFSQRGGATPYAYDAVQRLALAEGGLSLNLSVRNRGETALPFGLGWHPYFPMTPGTTLQAPACLMWTEVEGWLPGEPVAIPPDLDFAEPRPLPHHWVDNGFEGWQGTAVIDWPERRTRLRLTADPLFRHGFVFVSDTGFDPGFRRDFFCFEPMSHLANGHNLPGLGDLVVLQPGQELAGGVRLRPEVLESPARE